MPTQITNHKCPSCNGPLHFAGPSGKLECDFCGGSFDVAEIETLYKNKEKKAQEAFSKTGKKPTGKKKTNQKQVHKKQTDIEQEEFKWDESDLSRDWGEEARGVRMYVCPSCGAELLTDDTTAATSCPYCGNPAIVPGQFGGALKPDYVIPFKLDKDAAKAALKQHYRRKIFLPRAFSAANHIEELKGIYVPFWLFDAQAEADCSFYGARSVTARKGDEEVTTTSHFEIRRSGTMAFRRIPTDASRKMPDDYMDSLEPFDYGELKPFSTAYLPGYLADKYDVSTRESAQRADLRCRTSAIDRMRRDVTGYEVVTLRDSNVRLERGKIHYALMPVWTLRTKWEGQEYLFMMNGQTGKMVGNLPISKKKYWAAFGTLSVLFSSLMLYLNIGQWIVEAFLD